MYIWLNTILQGGVLTPETPPLRTPMADTDVVTGDTNNKKVDDIEVSKTLRKKLPNKFIKPIVIKPKLQKDIQLLHYSV